MIITSGWILTINIWHEIIDKEMVTFLKRGYTTPLENKMSETFMQLSFMLASINFVPLKMCGDCKE